MMLFFCFSFLHCKDSHSVGNAQEKTTKIQAFRRYFHLFGLSFQPLGRNKKNTENFFKKVWRELKKDLTLLHNPQMTRLIARKTDLSEH